MDDVTLHKKIPAIHGITCDSRQARPGYAFVAINGFKTDGNNYIKEAIDKGAAIIFTDKKLEKKIINQYNIPIIHVENARAYLAYLAAEFYDYPSNKINLIGITGTNGKTTTTHLIYHLLNHTHLKDDIKNIPPKKAGLIGTVQVDTGKTSKPGNLTTPDPVSLQKYLLDMVDNGLKFACIEISSHGIKLDRIKGNQFSVKVGTNITADHFDLHPNFDDYKNVKRSFLEDKSKDTLVLLNSDNNYIKSFGVIAKKQLNFAIHKNADIIAKNISQWKKGQSFIYELKKSIKNANNYIKPCTIPIKMNLPGEHNIYNALIAITIAYYYNTPIEVIQNFFENFQGIWRRMQFIYDEEFTIIDDCAHNPGSYNAIFNSINNMNFNKLIIVNSLRGNRGIKINEENANTISSFLKELREKEYFLITTNCNDVVQKIDKVKKQEEKAFLRILEKNNVKYEHLDLLEPALQKALKKVSNNDIILLVGPHAMDNAGNMVLNMF
ncbi:MAG: Mur ligase family protein [Halanaerobiaceae bacterium]